jgi:NgoBV restriction endonuclease
MSILPSPSKSEYHSLQDLDRLCKSFIGEKIELKATFMGRDIPITNVNIVGNLLEDVFFPLFKSACPDFEEGPDQAPPDFYAQEKEFQFELKAFCKGPGFDISNFASFINQISEPGGLIKKLFKTKYLVFEYAVNGASFVIKQFWLLNIWNLPTYDNKYPISMQQKKSMWYNIRPGVKTSWSDQTKTPHLFIEKILECIAICPNHIENRETIIESITKQAEEAKTLGFL